jgi:biotin carboxyl carrier protein
MPNYEALIDGKPRKIELARLAPNSFTAKLDDKPHKIELQTDKIKSEEAFIIKVDDKTYKIELPKVEQEKIIPVKVEEVTFKVEIRSPSRRQAITSFEPAPLAATKKTSAFKQVPVEGAVAAPMTGKIVQVKVKKGDQVKEKQVLCIIEAMKMENEITAPKAGTVQEINVGDGQSVSEGEVLFIVS